MLDTNLPVTCPHCDAAFTGVADVSLDEAEGEREVVAAQGGRGSSGGQRVLGRRHQPTHLLVLFSRLPLFDRIPLGVQTLRCEPILAREV